MIRVLVVAASEVVRAGLASLLSPSSRITVVDSADADAALTERIEAVDPDVVLVDVESGEAERLPSFGDEGGHVPAIVLLADASDASRFVSEGTTRSLLMREASGGAIIAAVEAAAAGLLVVDARLASAVWGRSAAATLATATAGAVDHRNAARRPAALTRREAEILGMLADGLANKNIATRLGISEHTVKTHVASILTKLGASSRAEAVAIGARRGVIML